jgi:wobble nucleotide-excising tRNase
MLNSLQLVRNIGLFDSVSSGASLTLGRLTVVYAENGRGKTTLAAILRSLASGDPIPIAERRRLAALQPPHVVVSCDGGPAAMFQNNAWNRTVPNLAVLDDVFVDENIHSGLAVAAGHRQKLHELILGAQAVALNRQLQQVVDRIEVHNTALRERAAAIPAAERGALSVDDFCALSPRADIDDAISEVDRNLAVAREQEPVRTTPLFDSLSLPPFDVAGLERVLAEDLPSLDAIAAEQVRSHLSTLGPGGEMWVNEGMARISQTALPSSNPVCPFCAQGLGGSPVIDHYRAYFSEAYESLKRRIAAAITQTNQTHGDDRPAGFERAVRLVVERRQFWSRFVEIPQIVVDTESMAQDRHTTFIRVMDLLNRKRAAPLERMELDRDTRTAIERYNTCRDVVTGVNHVLEEANSSIRVAKERAVTSNAITIAGDLSRLRAVKVRHSPATAALCDDYLSEKAAKGATELERDRLRTALDSYRRTVFASYQTAVNLYLQRFNAGFRLDSVTSTNTRGGHACTYNVVINNRPVAVGGDSVPGEPSFRNVLSSGDRSTLALGFFFASLDQDRGLGQKVVVIDDPVSSLDDHRALTTIQEIRRLATRAAQVVVLSHNKPFLCRIWENTDPSLRVAIQIARDGPGSTIRDWDVDQDCVTEHDRRHALLRDYLSSSAGNPHDIAAALRPVLEAFFRVTCPEAFLPGSLLGPFLNTCNQRVGSPREILDAQGAQELEDLLEYANRFHHDTNPGWQSEHVNDRELQGFVRRTLEFTKP